MSTSLGWPECPRQPRTVSAHLPHPETERGDQQLARASLVVGRDTLSEMSNFRNAVQV